ncbi:lysophospholipase [Moraxella sp. Tifton1]|uniref:alpha/beta fold hydrolase n=1 Tax=Moraxella oculi TaxID=2940516 RepID=UPI002013097D|nr:alpha/beta fold hydrolase [Moraxella sp. Tifton1]MCL1623109.1 lysophospholipase [Moraxella sp. Tifton1]
MTQKTILSSNGIHRLHHTFFTPKSRPIASLLIVHGMSEHGGRYADFAQFLADNGVLVATYDQLGHGQTVKDKYELGFFDEKYPVQILCKDVIIMADKLKELAPSVPHFIMGHSMGSFIVRTVLTHHAINFSGVILMGTSNGLSLMGKISLPLLNLLNQYRPKQINLALATLLNQHLLNQIRSPISTSPLAWLAENASAIDDFEADELSGFVFTNNGFMTLISLIDHATHADWYMNMPKQYPILLISGKDDPVGNMGQDIETLHQTLVDANHTVSVRLYPNMRHDILHEVDREKVCQDILHWLRQHLKQN